MTATRDEIRDHLTAVIEAARELPKDDRAYLADTFLDDLESRYQLVPRSTAERQTRPLLGRSWLGGFPIRWSPVSIGLVLLASLLVLPTLLFSVGVLLHPPILVLIVLLFFIFRSRFHHGPRRQGRRRGMIL